MAMAASGRRAMVASGRRAAAMARAERSATAPRSSRRRESGPGSWAPRHRPPPLPSPPLLGASPAAAASPMPALVLVRASAVALTALSSLAPIAAARCPLIRRTPGCGPPARAPRRRPMLTSLFGRSTAVASRPAGSPAGGGSRRARSPSCKRRHRLKDGRARVGPEGGWRSGTRRHLCRARLAGRRLR
ncbi:hypothetical protein PVAP13_5NG353981 [Panicum virgatum]|uniref:Uncharacterized protein n=1 Tax=Panicum virgatum TaxID=38727 RepID=A0A8T0RU04_PANVG|nr:hypothetical protein PVAP13_5NG353981 [Panicum virgatum]